VLGDVEFRLEVRTIQITVHVEGGGGAYKGEIKMICLVNRMKFKVKG
jgi:hypothetical protein